MKAATKTAEPIQAAGGIVIRNGAEPLLAIVKLRKDKAWVLPKGKLKPGEDALAAARREVIEETGHDVTTHEFLGAMSHLAGGRPKVTQFWRMQADDRPGRKLMRDVRAVRWLSLDQAITTLTHAHEREFLADVGPAALQAVARSAAADAAPARHTLRERIRTWLRHLMQGRG
jgi:8-oxo-dGTP diphosphatase